MIGVFSYTVILTYISLVTGIVGITYGLSNNSMGAVICLLICGICDLFDGKIARTKKNRTQFEKDFGVQIDSLTDMITFGILPIALGYSLGLTNNYFMIIYGIYGLCGMIRLAFFNSLELEEQRNKTNKPKQYIGLPITSAGFIFPILYVFKDINSYMYIYAIVMLLLALLFIVKIKIKKPTKKNFAILIVIVGIIELLFILKGIIW